MTNRMAKAIEALKSMPEDKQDSFADFVLHELESDARWAQTTEANGQKLDKLVAEVLEADRRGETEPLDPDKL